MSNIRVLAKLNNINTDDIVTESLSSNALLISNVLHIDKILKKVGIGTDHPVHDLEVNGTFSAKTKSFLITHPSDSSRKLQYGSLESPYHGVRLTGKSNTLNGISKIELPSYICDLVKDEDINVQLTNINHSHTLFINSINIRRNFFIVKSDYITLPLSFYWTFTAIRKDVPDMAIEI